MSLISSQPNTSTMDVYGPLSTHEKRSLTCQHNDHNLNYPCECSSASHRACHKSRLRRIILPIALSLLSIGAFLIISHCSEIGDLLEALGLNHGHVSGVLDKRQTTTGSSFTSKKLYLIIIFVGLVLVLLAAVMLSFWCCKGAFENPLCCPCYLCACCGGLACLECIGCGLCAAGIDEAL
ncbi:hypothetical protein EV424DRAFT_739108 [Suillus variegatus]|nr:hypothetical protein EV424DRAFT_739108 [Suillus variegatus]